MAANISGYYEKPEFGERLLEKIGTDPREVWWDQVLSYVKTWDGDFVELVNPPVAWRTIRRYRQAVKNKYDEWVPQVFHDPMFEVVQHNGRIYVRYIPD
jgi:hypothetical protein